MSNVAFPVIDPVATGKNILSLRKEKGLTVRNLQEFFGFEEPQAIYRWQYGKTLPSVDNLYALSAILGVPMERILVPATYGNLIQMEKQQELPAASVFIQLIHEEVCIYNADFYFFFRFPHDEDYIGVLFCLTLFSSLGLQKKIQIPGKSEFSLPMLYTTIPVAIP